MIATAPFSDWTLTLTSSRSREGRIFPVKLLVGTYHNRLLVPFDEYREFIDFMAGEYVFLGDIARARRIIAEELKRQVPALAKTDPPPEKTDSGAGGRYAKAAAKQLGQSVFTIRPLRKGAWQASEGKGL